LHFENLQCGNYGIGGHYGTHPDYYDYDERKFYDPESRINRISTVMTVLEAPEAGGATAFPFVGVTAIPEKGSAEAWFNTRTDAQGLMLKNFSAVKIVGRSCFCK